MAFFEFIAHVSWLPANALDGSVTARDMLTERTLLPSDMPLTCKA